MKRPIKPTSEEQFSRTIGVDIGYGDLKGANSVNTMIMPSVIGLAPTSRYSDEWARDDGDIVYDDDGVWFVGEKALEQSKAPRAIKDRSRSAMPDYKRLLYVAMGRLHPHQNDNEITTINIATGLPVTHMGDKDELRQMILGEHRVHTVHANGLYYVENVAVMPQGYGTLLYNTLDEYGNLINDQISKSKAFVVDIGRFTTNLIAVEAMSYIEYASNSINYGVALIEDTLKRHLENDLHWTDVRPDVIRDIILDEKHVYNVDGEDMSFVDVINEGTNDLAQHVNGLIADQLGEAREYRFQIVTGGGGIILEDWIKERYKRTYLTQDPVLANAIGFARYGRRKWAL
jgi:hypothetical protein